MSSLEQVIGEHRFEGWLDTRTEPQIEDGEAFFKATPQCVCGWQGDDWPAHVAQAIIDASEDRTEYEEVIEYAVDFAAGYCSISEEPANAYEMAQFMVDASVVRRVVLRAKWETDAEWLAKQAAE